MISQWVETLKTLLSNILSEPLRNTLAKKIRPMKMLIPKKLKNMIKKHKVKLINENDNAFNILGIFRKALKEIGQADKIKEFLDETTRGNYNYLLQACLK